jgi:hypothetical protein
MEMYGNPPVFPEDKLETDTTTVDPIEEEKSQEGVPGKTGDPTVFKAKKVLKISI